MNSINYEARFGLTDHFTLMATFVSYKKWLQREKYPNYTHLPYIIEPTYQMRFHQCGKSLGTQVAETGSLFHHIRFSPVARPKPSCIDEYKPDMMLAEPVTCAFANISLAPNVSAIPDPPHPHHIINPNFVNKMLASKQWPLILANNVGRHIPDALCDLPESTLQCAILGIFVMVHLLPLGWKP